MPPWGLSVVSAEVIKAQEYQHREAGTLERAVLSPVYPLAPLQIEELA